MPVMYEEILEIIKQRLLPEIQEMKEFRTEVRAELRVINGRLDVIEKRLDGMDKRFEQVDKRFDQVNQRFEQIDKRFEQVDLRFLEMGRHFEQIERRVSDLHDDLREVRSYAFTSRMHEGAQPYQVREPGK
jgi:chromosome segregation ATPase